MEYSNAYVIGARETVKGFALIGIEGQEVSTPSEALTKLEEILSKGYKIVILSASVAQGLDEELFRLRKEHVTPIIVISDLNTKVNPNEMQENFRKLLGI